MRAAVVPQASAKADQQIGVTIAPDLLLIHIGEQEVLCFLILLRHPRIDVAEVVGERTDIVVVVLGPAREMRAAELAARPGDAERRLVGALSLDGIFEGRSKFHVIHQLLHRGAPVP
ncbi:hypothetical protein ACVWY2_008170 [Bradyrhizobium sp. JR6.1]